MRIYNLLSGGLKPIDYILIAGLITITVAITAIVVWRKAKGKGGCDCGSCKSCPSSQACNRNCEGCNSCPSKKEDENEQEKTE